MFEDMYKEGRQSALEGLEAILYRGKGTKERAQQLFKELPEKPAERTINYSKQVNVMPPKRDKPANTLTYIGNNILTEVG